MNDGGWISTSHSIRSTAPEVLFDHQSEDVIIYCTGLNVSVTFPRAEAVRMAEEILTASNTGSREDS